MVDSLEFICKMYYNVIVVWKVSDFNKLGGCNLFCGFWFWCGYVCS